MDLVTTAFLALGVWVLSRFVILELVKASWQKAALSRQLVKAASLAAAEKLVQVSFTCAATLLCLWIVSLGIRAIGAFTPDNVWAAVGFLDLVAAVSKFIAGSVTLVVLGLLAPGAIWYAWQEGEEAIANHVRAHIARARARFSEDQDGKIHERLDEKPLSIELILAPKHDHGLWTRIASFVLSRGFVSSASFTGRLVPRVGLVALSLSIVWVKADSLADASARTVNELIVKWEQKRTREDLHTASVAPDKTPTDAESIEIANQIASDLIAVMSRDPVFRFRQPPPPGTASAKRGLRSSIVRAAILDTERSSAWSGYLKGTRSSGSAHDIVVKSAVRTSPQDKGEWLLAIPGVAGVFPDVREKFKAYAQSFAEPVSPGTLYDTVLDQVARHVWGLAPLETDSGTGLLAKRVVDEFGVSFLKNYLEVKLQQMIIRLATSASPYDPVRIAEELRSEERAVPRTSVQYDKYLDAATGRLDNARELAATILPSARPAERKSSSGVQAVSATRYRAQTPILPTAPTEAPPAAAFLRYDDLTDARGNAVDSRKLESELQDRRLSHIADQRIAEREIDISDRDRVRSGFDREWDFRRETPRPQPRPRRKAIEASGDDQHTPWTIQGPHVILRWSRNGKSLTLHARAAGAKQPEQVLGTFDSDVVHQALRFAADGRTLLVTIHTLTGGHGELRRILLHPSLENSALGCAVARIDVTIADVVRRRLGSGPERKFTYIGLRERPRHTQVADAGATTGHGNLRSVFEFVADPQVDTTSRSSGREPAAPSSQDVFREIGQIVSRGELQLLAEFTILQRFFRSALYGPLSDRIEPWQLVLLAQETRNLQASPRTPKWDVQYAARVPAWLDNDNDCGFAKGGTLLILEPVVRERYLLRGPEIRSPGARMGRDSARPNQEARSEIVEPHSTTK
jgi:hypothetical protein